MPTRAFQSGEMEEDNVENADETHFAINMDNGRTLGFKGLEEVKWADVVYDRDGITIVVTLIGGIKSRIEPGFMVFKNKDRNYPIRGFLDDVNGAAYSTGPKGMDGYCREDSVVGRARLYLLSATQPEAGYVCR